MPDPRNILAENYKLHWYEIKAMLGHGGFGLTYLARDPNLNQWVAIKEYLPGEMAHRLDDHTTVAPITEEHSDLYSWGLDRFITEARTLAQFKHPNIVRVISVFEENDTAYMVMEYEQGKNLNACLDEGKFQTEEELLAMTIPILEGLEEVHAAGFIHRDIKPDNIYIRKDNSPVLLDFGSARESVGQKTVALTSLYTPGYAPFEQYHESGGRQGPWTDLYGLAATLYLAVTHNRPEDSMRRSASYIHGTEDPYIPVAERAVGKYSKNFLDAIDMALNFKEADRPQSAHEWKQMLLGKKVKQPSKKDTPETPATKPQKHTNNKTPLLVGSIIIMLLGIGGYLWWLDNNAAPEQAEQAQTVTPAVITTTPEVVSEAPEPVVNPQAQKIRDLLEKAAVDYKAGRLITPAGSNALMHYQAVLKLDPHNAIAKNTANEIKTTIFENIRSAIRNEQYASAADQLNQAISSFGESDTSTALKDAIDDGRDKAQQAKAQQAAEQKKQQLAQAKAKQAADLKKQQLAQAKARQLAEQKNQQLAQAKAKQAAQQKQQQQISQLLIQAVNDIAAGKLANTPDKQDALSRYQQVLKLDPGNATALKGIASLTEKLTAQVAAAPEPAQSNEVIVTTVVYIKIRGIVEKFSRRFSKLLRKLNEEYAPDHIKITHSDFIFNEDIYNESKQYDAAKNICRENNSTILLGGYFEHDPGDGQSDDVTLIAYNCKTQEFFREVFTIWHSGEQRGWADGFKKSIKTFLQSNRPFARI